MSVKEYTKQFYRLNIMEGHVENDVDKVARYTNGLRYDIQDEINLLTPRNVEYDYQVALKSKDKITRK
jgi:hypothetical protein